MSQQAVARATEWTEWWSEHKAESGDVMKRIERLEKAVSGAFDVISFLLEDIAELEGRPRGSLGKRLWTPGGMKFQGDVTKFG